jgi:hypothetical protein
VPLSIALCAVSTVVLGIVPGLLAALVGGFLGLFLNPAAYPFGPVDVLFVAILPAAFSAFSFRGDQATTRFVYAAIILICGLFAELVPYYYPGNAGGFTQPPPQPLYALLVGLFCIPWLSIYLSPLGTRYIPRWLHSPNATRRFLGGLLGALCGLFPWSLLMIAPAALILNISPQLAIGGWLVAAASRSILSVIAAGIAAPLIQGLGRSGMPAPTGALWEPSPPPSQHRRRSP